jgi:hypothetical protein
MFKQCAIDAQSMHLSGFSAANRPGKTRRCVQIRAKSWENLPTPTSRDENPMSHPAETSPARAPNPVWRACLLLLCLLSLIPSLYGLVYFRSHPEQLQQSAPDQLGIEALHPGPTFGHCARIAHGVRPDGAFARAGGQEGDALCYHPTLEIWPYLTPDLAKGIKLDVMRGTQQLTLALPGTPLLYHAGERLLHRIDAYGQPLSNLVLLLVAMLIGWRAGQQKHLRYLSLGLLFWSLWQPHYASEQSERWLVPLSSLTQLALACFIAFVLHAPQWRNDRPWWQRWRALLPWYVLLCLASVGGEVGLHGAQWNGLARTSLECLRLFHTLLGYVMLASCLALGQHASHGPVRERLDLLMPLFCLTLIVHIQPGLYYFFPAARNAWLVGFEYGMALLLPLALGYAILRHRVLDLGYILNRALLFSLLTLVLATLFGIAEFTLKTAAKDYLKRHFTNNEDLLTLWSWSMSIAVILSFRHLHHWLEHGVQNLFFHQWNVAAAQLQQQVKRIAQIDEADLVLHRFAEALQSFAPMHSLCLYVQPFYLNDGPDYAMHDTSGDYLQAHLIEEPGIDLPPQLDFNHPLMTELRCGTLALESEDEPDLATSLPFRLALALQLRGRVMGVVLLGQKHDEHRYRPDEIVLLKDGCEQIALDLENLRVARLQQRHQQQRHELHLLREQAQIK